MEAKFTIANHRLIGAEALDSPNCDARPSGVEIELLVIHSISLPPGQFGTGCPAQLFCNELDCDSHPYFDQLRDLRVSAHLLIDRYGSATQFVPFDRRAWHAGKSHFQGRTCCNDFSIGIELEGCDDKPFTDGQYEVLSTISGLLLSNYPALNVDRILGHSDIAPGRKTDPGPHFDWSRYRTALCAGSARP